MRNIIILLVLANLSVFAQEAKDSTLYKWIPKGIVGFNIASVNFDNWTQGGENSISYALSGNFGVDYKSDKFQFFNNAKIVYGQTKLGGDEVKTNDNEIYIETVYKRLFGWVVDPYISNTIRTNVAAGYKYDKDTTYQIANFFDPGYISQSIGFAFDKVNGLQFRLGLGFQEIFTSDYVGYSDDPETNEIEKFKFETGIESVTDYELVLMENIMYKTKLRLFTAFKRIDTWDVYWDNTIAAQVNKYIVVNLNVLMVYEKSQSIKTQMKQALQIGITYSIF